MQSKVINRWREYWPHVLSVKTAKIRLFSVTKMQEDVISSSEDDCVAARSSLTIPRSDYGRSHANTHTHTHTYKHTQSRLLKPITFPRYGDICTFELPFLSKYIPINWRVFWGNVKGHEGTKHSRFNQFYNEAVRLRVLARSILKITGLMLELIAW